ncbi:MAG TPA: cytochrome C oxidase subunit IV family protein [Kofleriaceae bacterium]|jgi:caa(3)-type oxidase subunit IV|nr:cytochrome C oxidase subunit IV family protein [Kofleriaceae bacterium]
MADLTPPEETSGRRYVLALIALLLLTALTFGLHFAPLGGTLGVSVAMLIAAVKVGIVAAVFMELRDAFAATRLVAAVSVAFVALLCLGIVGDVAFR